MPDYSKSKIYRIVCNETGKTYYGSTTRTLAQRRATHVSSFKTKKQECSSSVIFEKGNYDIVLCEEYPCETKEQLHMRERWYIENNECVNKVNPIRTNDEKLEYQQKYMKEYNKTDKIREYQANYELTEKCKHYRHEYSKTPQRKEYMRQYRSSEEYKQKRREYRLKKKMEKEQLTSHISS
jgi:hypothetical protein